MARIKHDSLSLPGLEEASLSPIRRQYLELKRQAGEAILFFRLGDFYETFDADAQLAASILDIALTSREMGRGERSPMAGIPAHSADAFVARLIAAGRHVAIAEQIGLAGRTGLMAREISRIITPGTVRETDLLASARNNFIAAVVGESLAFGVAYLDITTGHFHTTQVAGPNASEILASELTRIGPAECLVAEGEDRLRDLLPAGTSVTPCGLELFTLRGAGQAITRLWGGSIESTGLADAPLATRAAGALLSYVQHTRANVDHTLELPRLYDLRGAMVLDRQTQRNLEVLDASSSSGRSLLTTVDRTSSSMGARLIRAWLGQPLLNPDRINARLDAVDRLASDEPFRRRLSAALRGLPDLERLAVRAGEQMLAPRECVALASGLERVVGLRTVLASANLPPILGRAAAALDAAPEAVSAIRRTIREGATVFEEGVIQSGVSPGLDEQRSLGGDAREWIAGLEQRERERGGVRSARIGYNRVFGYYLEVSTAQCAQQTDYYQRQLTGAATVAEHLEKLGWQRKQTLANAERFITPELKELETRVSRAKEEAIRLEREIYNDLLQHLATVAPRVLQTARSVAEIDVLAGLAETACIRRYVRPLVDSGDALEIAGGRHPIVEAVLPVGRFMPNDTLLGPSARVMLLTGPNMAGKSTYLRQVALIVLLAQVGSFVPADAAHIGVVDRIFTRIGAHDDIASGRSTFMVEMTEAAAILRSATQHSLVVLDEVGRGTSTFDGMAIAQAILEDLHDQHRPGGAPKAIFATHFFELTSLAGPLALLRNYRLDTLEEGDDVVFLHAVVEGGADRSYGVHVARLAGVPGRVTLRAAELLRQFERSAAAADAQPRERAAAAVDHCGICEQIGALDVLSLTPIQAQAELARLQTMVAEGH